MSRKKKRGDMMRKIRRLINKRTAKRVQAITLSAAMLASSISFDYASAAELSWKTDVSGALENVLAQMENQNAYDTAVEDLSVAIEGLEGAATVEGLTVTEVGEDTVTIEWNAFQSDSLVGYNVYWGDKNTETEQFALLNKDGSKAQDETTVTVGKDVTSFTYRKSTHVNHYFKVAPVLSNGVGSKTAAVKSPTANQFEAYLENLGRGLIAAATSNGVFLSWRFLGTEVNGYSETGLTGTNFNVYQDGNLLATVTDSTNYMVMGGTASSEYSVVPVIDGVEDTENASTAYLVLTDTDQQANYLDINLQVPASTTIEEVYGIDRSQITLLNQDRTDAYTTTDITYSANDVSVGDVDGDGEYEFFVKWDPSLSKDVSQQGYTGICYIDCYKLDGTLLYRIDLGKNIRAGAHYTQFLVYDFNEDGQAEIAMKTAPGTRVIKYIDNDQTKGIESFSYITTPDGESNEDADYVFSAADYRQHFIDMVKDWGIWANDSADMVEAKENWDKNIIHLFAPEDGMVSVVEKNGSSYTTTKYSWDEAVSMGLFAADDVVVNVPVRDENGDVVYQGTGVANAYMETVKYDDPKTGMPSSVNREGNYTDEEAEAIADYFLNGYQYRMKKHNLNNYEGYIITGSEYLTVFDGKTGIEMDTIEYPFLREDDGMLWGDYAMNYMEPGNRCDRFLATVAYLDGETPSMVFGRGYYTRQTVASFTLSEDGKLEQGLAVDSGWTQMTNPFNDGPHGMNGMNTEEGTNGISYSTFTGQGDHYMLAADVDGDGCQEIIYGGATVDNNGDIYSSGGGILPNGNWAKYGHGDSIHVTDIDPDRPGLEIFACFEGGAGAPYGTSLRDAETNITIDGLFSVYTGADTGRCMIGDIRPDIRGIETWGVNTTDAKGNLISGNTVTTNQTIKWSADLTTEGYTGSIVKSNGASAGTTTLVSAAGTSSNNGTKGNAGLIADIFGDFREELVVRTTDSSALRVYTTTEVTDHKLYTLMHDVQYRTNVAGQQTGYNQPAYTSFYYAADMDWEYVPVPNAKKSQEGGAVAVEATGVSIPNNSITVGLNQVSALEATVIPEKATDKTVTWTSADESIATVSADGVVTAVSAGTVMITATTSNGKTAQCKVIVKGAYTPSGADNFAIGETKSFAFGEGQTMDAATVYSSETGYGWESTDKVSMTAGEGYVAANNVRTESGANVTYDYPTFLMDVPAGIYEVTLVQGSDTEDTVNGAYVEGNMYSVRWSTENFSTGFTEPTAASQIVTPAGEEKVSTVTTAVTDGQLSIQLATGLTDAGVSGTTYIKSIEVKRVEQITEDSSQPTLRFIGDSTVATYPPEDGGTWTPIPERTGWGGEFAMERFTDGKVALVNKAVAGSSIKSYVSDGYFNDFFLNSHPNDTVIIEGGINDSAAGRRYSDAADYEKYLRYFIDSCKTFGLDVVLSSGTSSATLYTDVMEKLAEEYGLTYIDLLGEFTSFKNTISSTAQGALTVDGTHLSRVGGVLAAQIVANALESLEGLSISNHVKADALIKAAPTVTASDLAVKAQTENSVTLSWSLDEASLYQPDQLVISFNIYRKASGAADTAYEVVGTQTAYVSAGMDSPKMQTTIAAPTSGNYTYAVAAVGVAGEGEKSSPLTVKAFTASDAYSLRNLVAAYNEQMQDATHYTAESYAPFALALAKAEAVLADSEATAADVTEALAAVKAAEANLVSSAVSVIKEDFQQEALGSKWGLGGNALASVEMEEDGNRLLNVYVEAAGNRNNTKAFTAVDSDVTAVEFEWYPGDPDNRNLTEIQFSDASGVYFGLKTACSGTIGYVVGAYPTDSTAYLTGDGFHEGNTNAHDLGLSNEAWYDVRIVFNYADHTADLYISNEDTEKVVTDIAIPEAAAGISMMNFFCQRGKQDNGTSNDLSILWDSYVDNFAINYVAEKAAVDTTSYEEAKAAYKAATAGIDAAALITDEFALAEIVMDAVDKDFGFATAADYAYAAEVLQAAASIAAGNKPVESIEVAGNISVAAGRTTKLTASLAPAGALGTVTWTSSDAAVAAVAGKGLTATVTGIANGTAVITATASNGVSATVEVTVGGEAYFFGSDVTAASAYSDETGFGFVDYSYPEEAAGWVDGVYQARKLVKNAGTSYVAAGTDSLAISGTVWYENPGDRDEDAILYENTSAFEAALPNGDYTVAVTLTNPTASDMDVIVRAEDITRYSSGDHATAELAQTTVPAGKKAEVTFDLALTDGKLTLRFEQASDAASFKAAKTSTVYVESVSAAPIENAETSELPAIFVLGDSTVQTYTRANYRTGWGQVLADIFGTKEVVAETDTGYASYKTEDVAVENYARDARSAKSFLTEGRLNEVLLNVEEGDYVFAQFTHNDSNTARPNRYLSETEFRTYLENYKAAIEDRGATFVLVTPIILNVFTDGVLDHRFESYRQVMLEMAAEDNIPVIDLMGESYALLNAMGSANVNALAMYMSDTVHLQANGANMYKTLIANQLAANDNAALDGLKAALDTNVSASVAFGSNELAVTPGSTTPFAATASEGTVVYYSSDEKIATVDAAGNITAVAQGEAIITAAVVTGDTATTDCTAYTDYCLVKVGNVQPMVLTGAISVDGAGVTVDTEADVEDMMSKFYKGFDFGSKKGNGEGYTAITNGAYSAETGYGFTANTNTGAIAFGNVGITVKDTAADMGLITAAGDLVRVGNTLEFAMDLPAGTYRIDVLAGAAYKNNAYNSNTITVNGVALGASDTILDEYENIEDHFVSCKVTVPEGGGQVVVLSENPSLAILNAVVVSTYVEEVKDYDQAAWDTLADAIAVLELKMDMMADDSTPLDYDTSLVTKMTAVTDALTEVKGMPVVDEAAAEKAVTAAKEAIENKALYTESSLAKVTEGLAAVNEILEVNGDTKEIVTDAKEVIEFWLDGVDTDIEAPVSLYADMDLASSSTPYLTEGFTSISRDTVYDAEKGYGLAAAFADDRSAGRNRGTGDSLLDDWFFASTFKVDLVPGEYSIRYYSADLLAGCKAKSQLTVKDAAGNVLGENETQTASDAGMLVRDLTFTVTEEGTVDLVFGGYYNAFLLEEVVKAAVEEISIEDLIALVDEIHAAGLVETEYTVSTWTALEDALTEAEAAIDRGAAFAQQAATVLKNLQDAYEGLVEREVAREIKFDFGTETSAVSTADKLSGDGGLSTMGTEVMQGLGSMVFGEYTLDNGQFVGFDREMPAYETAQGGAHFRDYVYSEGGAAYTFTAELPIGQYYVYVYTGDKLSANVTKFYFNDGEAVGSTNTAADVEDGRTVYTQTSNAGGQFSAPACIYTVEVTDEDVNTVMDGVRMGTVSITLFDDTTTNAEAITARLNGIEFTPVDPSDDTYLQPVKPEQISTYVIYTDGVESSLGGEVTEENGIVTAEAKDGFRFDGWYKIYGDYERVVTDEVSTELVEHTTLIAKFVSEESFTVRFESNGNLIDTKTVKSGECVMETTEIPVVAGYTFIGWDFDFETPITEDTVIAAVFEKNAEICSLTVTNGTANVEEAEIGTVVTIEAEETEGMVFAYWIINGEIMKTSAKYSFYIMENTEAEAVFTEEAVEAEASITSKTPVVNEEAAKISFTTERFVPEEFEVTVHGLLMVNDAAIGEDEEAFVIGAEGVLNSKASGKTRVGTYTASKGKVAAGATWYSRGYITYTDAEGESHTVYSNIVSATMPEEEAVVEMAVEAEEMTTEETSAEATTEETTEKTTEKTTEETMTEEATAE